MNLTDVAVGAFLLAAVTRVVVSYRRKDPLGEALTQATGAGLAAIPLSVGVVVAPVRYVLKLCPETKFYEQWLTDPLFITFAGLAYAVLGGALLIRVFQSRRF